MVIVVVVVVIVLIKVVTGRFSRDPGPCSPGRHGHEKST
jgi:hypothetical protein